MLVGRFQGLDPRQADWVDPPILQDLRAAFAPPLACGACAHCTRHGSRCIARPNPASGDAPQPRRDGRRCEGFASSIIPTNTQRGPAPRESIVLTAVSRNQCTTVGRAFAPLTVRGAAAMSQRRRVSGWQVSAWRWARVSEAQVGSQSAEGGETTATRLYVELGVCGASRGGPATEAPSRHHPRLSGVSQRVDPGDGTAARTPRPPPKLNPGPELVRTIPTVVVPSDLYECRPCRLRWVVVMGTFSSRPQGDIRPRGRQREKMPLT